MSFIQPGDGSFVGVRGGFASVVFKNFIGREDP